MYNIVSLLRWHAKKKKQKKTQTVQLISVKDDIYIYLRAQENPDALHPITVLAHWLFHCASVFFL